MLLMPNNQTIEEYATTLRNDILLNSLNDVKEVISDKEFTNDERVHLIKSRLIVEKAELKRANERIKDLNAADAFVQSIMSGDEAGCDCENMEAPVGQLTVFEFLEMDSDLEPESEGKEERATEAIKNELPEEVVNTMQELTSVLQAVFGK